MCWTCRAAMGEMMIAFEDAISCRACGCTDDDCYCCVESTGIPCWWVEEDICSACAATPGCSGLQDPL